MNKTQPYSRYFERINIFKALINFLLALFLGRKAVDLLISKYGRIFLLNKEQLGKTDRFFKKHGEITTFVGRLIPWIRQLISIPAGFSRMNLLKFCFFTGLGAGLWTLVLIYVGYVCGNNTLWIRENMSVITLLVLLFALMVLIVYILWNKKHKNLLKCWF